MCRELPACYLPLGLGASPPAGRRGQWPNWLRNATQRPPTPRPQAGGPGGQLRARGDCAGGRPGSRLGSAAVGEARAQGDGRPRRWVGQASARGPGRPTPRWPLELSRPGRGVRLWHAPLTRAGPARGGAWPRPSQCPQPWPPLPAGGATVHRPETSATIPQHRAPHAFLSGKT